MKYSDTQRLEKIAVTAEKLLTYLRQEQITAEDIWSVAAPLDNHHAALQRR